VKSINIKEGNYFQAKDILLTLDCRIQQADLDKAHALQTLSKAAIENAKKLRQYGSISNYEFAQATSQSEQANADVSKLEAIVEKCTVRAPFNGSVANLLVHEYETVKPGDPLLKIVSTENLNVALQVSSNWLRWLHIGSIFYVHVNEINKTIPVKIDRINPEINSVSQTVKINGKVNVIDKSLLPGMSGQASFPDNPDNKIQKGKKNNL